MRLTQLGWLFMLFCVIVGFLTTETVNGAASGLAVAIGIILAASVVK